MTHTRLEIAAVLLTGVAHFLIANWLDLQLVFIVGACLFWIAFVALRASRDTTVLATWGLTTRNFGRSIRILAPAAILTTACFIAYGLWTGACLLHWHIVLIGLMYPAWGLVQQFLIVALLAGNLRRQTRIPEGWLVLLAAGVFAAAHAHTLPLVAPAFCLALITTTVYFRTHNLWAVGIFHGWFATGLYFFALGRNPWHEVVAARMWP
jgi:hypothetical protein